MPLKSKRKNENSKENGIAKRIEKVPAYYKSSKIE
jgi:hypothetical protein